MEGGNRPGRRARRTGLRRCPKWDGLRAVGRYQGSDADAPTTNGLEPKVGVEVVVSQTGQANTKPNRKLWELGATIPNVA